MMVNDSKCRFAYSLNGKSYKEVGDEFQMREGKWIGAKMGFVAEEFNKKSSRGWVEADWFRVTK
jgi:hypothetical protein